MRRYVCDKLIRERMIQRLEDEGDVVHCRTLGDAEYLRALEAKLHEESLEVFEAPHGTQERLMEIADVLEVIHALIRAEGSSWEAVDALRLGKAAERGTFAPHTFCEFLDTPIGSRSDQHCINEGDRYATVSLEEAQ